MRFRTVLLCVSIYLFLRFRINFIFAFLWHFLIDALRFHNTAMYVAYVDWPLEPRKFGFLIPTGTAGFVFLEIRNRMAVTEIESSSF